MSDIDSVFWDCDDIDKSQSSELPKGAKIPQNVDFCTDIDISRSFTNLLVSVLEVKGCGVFDDVGGELWEASLLLSLHILKNVEFFQLVSVLELGAGVGLPSLLLIALRNNCPHDSGNIILTDYEAWILNCLEKSINQSHRTRVPSESGLTVMLRLLDWRIFADCSVSTDERLRAQGIDRDSVDVVIGSALCYTMDHVCLADLIRYYLGGRCREVLVCQVRDRAGFEALLERLSELGVRHSVEEVSQDIFDAAQKISLHSQSAVGGVSGEDEVLVRTVYDFGPAVEFLEETAGLLWSSGENANQQLSANTCKSGLISTSRDAFVLLRAFK